MASQDLPAPPAGPVCRTWARVCSGRAAGLRAEHADPDDISAAPAQLAPPSRSPPPPSPSPGNKVSRRHLARPGRRQAKLLCAPALGPLPAQALSDKLRIHHKGNRGFGSESSSLPGQHCPAALLTPAALRPYYSAASAPIQRLQIACRAFGIFAVPLASARVQVAQGVRRSPSVIFHRLSGRRVLAVPLASASESIRLHAWSGRAASKTSSMGRQAASRISRDGDGICMVTCP